LNFVSNFVRFTKTVPVASICAVAAWAAVVAPACVVGKIGDRGETTPSGAAGAVLMSPPQNGGAGAPATGTGGAAATGGTAGAGAPSGTAGTSLSGTAGAMAGTTGTAGTVTPGGGAAGATSSAPDAGGSATAGAVAPPVTTPHCKRGEAYESNSLNDLKTLSKGVSWWYNWTTSPEKSAGDYATAGVEFVPMIWGVKGGPPDPATIEKQIPKSAKYLLGFNEPNFAAQANITATDAAALWPRLEQIAKDMNLKLGSPAPNYCAGACNDTDPIHYLDAFFAACTGCQVDFIAAHWYACTGDALTSYLAKLKKYGKPIWLTEFSCMDAGDHSAAGEQTYMKTALQILENDPTIFRYSWFTGRWTDPTVAISLLAGDGQLTDLGNLYVTSAATNVCGP
jgi:hypothetical protein